MVKVTSDMESTFTSSTHFMYLVCSCSSGDCKRQLEAGTSNCSHCKDHKDCPPLLPLFLLVQYPWGTEPWIFSDTPDRGCNESICWQDVLLVEETNCHVFVKRLEFWTKEDINTVKKCPVGTLEMSPWVWKNHQCRTTQHRCLWNFWKMLLFFPLQLCLQPILLQRQLTHWALSIVRRKYWSPSLWHQQTCWS